MQRSKMGEFHWVDLSARDVNAQSEFYEAVLGWTHTDMPFGEGMVYRWFYSRGHSVAAMAQLSPEMIAGGAPSMWNTYVTVDDVDAITAKAVELGGTVAIPPNDVPADNGRLSAIQDPTGGFIFFWKPARLDETMKYFEPGTLSWNDLNTNDPEKAAAFYTALLGWEIEQQPVGGTAYWQINVDGQGEGGIMQMPAEDHSFWMPYFGSADIDADVAKAAEMGGAIHVEPTEIGDGAFSFAVITDPMGATFALIQSLKPMPA